MYINELPNILPHKTILFADDTSIVIRAKSRTDLQLSIKNVFTDLDQWFTANKMKLNINKTKIVKFKATIPDTITVDLYNQILISESNSKFLGTHIDQNLNWNLQAETVSKKLHSFAYALGIIRKQVSREACLAAYYAYVYSRLQYCLILWGYSADWLRVFRAQKRCIRAMFGMGHRDSCRLYFKNYKMLTYPCIYILECCLFVHKNSSLFGAYVRQHGYPTRERDRLLPPKTTLTKVQKNVVTQVINIFNRLPIQIKLLEKVKSFKWKIQQILVSKTYYSVQEYMQDEHFNL